MIRKFFRVAGSPITRSVVAVGILGLGIKMLTDIAAELRDRNDELVANIAEAQQQLLAVRADIAKERAGAKYPMTEDVDPLGRGGLVDEPPSASVEFDVTPA